MGATFNWKENNDTIRLLTFHTTKNRKFGRKSTSILERTITANEFAKSNFLEKSTFFII